ncbi:MAG: hypothetical protein KGK30_09845, partial [Elusimicrobia bacterium]|nr:hypothetical protein [Elusimicrobiota bacterium]
MSQEPWPPEASELEEPPANGGGGKSRPVLALLKIAALLSIVALCALSLRQDNGARRLPPKLGERYLEALRTNDYATAYGMLSRASRAAYSLDAFRKSLDASPWSWSGLALASSRPGLAALEYDFLAPGRPARRDTLIFALEQGRWVHPCDWPILRQARDAFARRNPALALLKAEEAARVDP